MGNPRNVAKNRSAFWVTMPLQMSPMQNESTQPGHRIPWVQFAALSIVLAQAHCGPDLLYLPSLAAGQLDVIANAVPIDAAIDDPDLSDDERSKLRLIRDVRAFARDSIGLTAGESYSLFYDNRDGARVHNVSASQQDRLEAVTWAFPVLGAVPYLGFFDSQQAEHQADTLRGDGLDVYTYEVDAYSTLDYLPNPVQATMLQRSDFSLIETVIHELLHNTVWRAGDVTFNESLATFFGRTGMLAYLLDRFPDSPELTETAIARFEDTDRYNAFFFTFYDQLQAHYAGQGSAEEKIAGRDAVFQRNRERFAADVQPLMHAPQNYDWVQDLPTNNAWVLANYRYNLDLDLFERVHGATDADWPRTLAVFADAAITLDPKAYLRQWLDTSTASR